MPQKGRRKSKMERYNIETYNFLEDEEFQKYLEKERKGKYLNHTSFLRLLEKCKKKWIQILNSPTLRHAYNLDYSFE